MNNKLFLLDAYALIYRAYFAFSRNPLMNSKGMNVSAISGFTSTLIDLITKEKPSHLAVVFDAPEQTERAAEHAFYKANREEMPEDIAQSIPWIKAILRAFHIPMLEQAGFEADDIIGTLAKQKAAEGHTVYMVTPDKDYGQLVADNILIYKPGRQGSDVEILGVKEICEKWEVQQPLQVIDVLGLWGDSVDNIPGIPGVGEKTAKKLIKEYGSMEAVLENAHLIKGKLGENLKQFKEQALISKKLATIVLNVPIAASDDDLALSTPDKEKLAEIFSELEFRTLGRRILGDDFAINQQSPAPAGGQISLFDQELIGTAVDLPTMEKGKNIHNTQHHYQCLQSQEEIAKLINELEALDAFCFDTETTALDLVQLELVGLSFSMEKGKAFYLPAPVGFDAVKAWLQPFASLFSSSKHLKIGQNIKFDMHVLAKYGIDVRLPLFDTMLAHYLLEPDLKHGMDYLSETYLGYTPVSIESLIGKKGKNQGNMRDVPLDEITAYAAEDADITLQLKEVFAPMVLSKQVDKVLNDIEHPLVPVLMRMEKAGIALDVDFLKEYSLEIGHELLQLRNQIFHMAGLEFNLDSPKQLGEVLFEKMKLPGGEKTKTGQYATGEEILQKLAAEHDIVHAILDYRELAKLKSTYVDALPALVNPHTGRIHTTFNQTIAATGRLSSVNPNLQNIPIRTERGQRVRKAFVAGNPDSVILSADYSQIELRLVAEISQEENMLQAFRDGHDIHQATAAKVFGVSLNEVSREQRSRAKMVNFGIIYAISAFGLSQRLGIARKEAQELIDNYFQTYPRIKQYMNDTLAFARAQGYVQTLMGRKRFLKDINSRNFTVRGFAEREAINTPIQGSAADLIKMAMIGIDREILQQQMKSRMVLQVHDELVFDAYRSELDALKELVSRNMSTAIKTQVPLVVEMGTGPHWLEAH